MIWPFCKGPVTEGMDLPGFDVPDEIARLRRKTEDQAEALRHWRELSDKDSAEITRLKGLLLSKLGIEFKEITK